MRRGVKHLLQRGAAALFLDPGLGKTSITYAALKLLLKEKVIHKVLVIAPLKPAQLVWPEEARKWDDFHGIRVVVLHGPNKEKLLRQDADVYVINYEGLPWLTGAVKVRSSGAHHKRWRIDRAAFECHGFDVLVVDELSKLKNATTQRFAILRALLPCFRRRWGLTGTPAPRGLLNLFSQVFVLDGGAALGSYYSQFRGRYFFPMITETSEEWLPKPGADKEIAKKLKPLVLRMAARDYITLPKLVETTTRFDIPAKVRDAYEELEDELETVYERKTFTAQNPAAATVKCRQFISGAVYRDNRTKDREWVAVHDERLKAFGELVDELQGQQLLVSYEFNHELERLRAAFPEASVLGKKPKENERTLKAWNAGEIPMLFAHPAAAGHGINAQESNAQHVAFFSLTWDLELYDQFIARVCRSGNDAKRVFVYRFIARNTVDEVILKSLARKSRTQSMLLDELGSYIKRRRAS